VTGIDTIARDLKQMMRGELAEKVETVYADVYHYPLIAAFLMLVIETFLGQAPKRPFVPPSPIRPHAARPERRRHA